MRRSLAVLLSVGLLAAVWAVTAGCPSAPPSDSLEALRQQVRRQPESAEARVALGQAYLKAKLYNDAFIAYREAADLDPKHFGALRGLAETSLQLGDAQGALDWIGRALALQPNDPAALGLRGRARLATRQVAQALPDLERAANLDPNLLEVRLALLTAYRAARQDAQALNQAAKLAAQFPSDPRVRFAYGTVLDRQGRIGEATLQYRETLRLDPDHRAAKFALALALVQQRTQLDEARRLAAEVDAAGPGDGTAAGLAARALFLSGKQEEGLRELGLVYRRHPENMQVVQWIKEAALQAGRPEIAEAADNTLRAAGLNPTSGAPQ